MDRAGERVLNRDDPDIRAASGNVLEYLPKAGRVKGSKVRAIERPRSHAAERPRYSLIGYPLFHGWWMIPQKFYGYHYCYTRSVRLKPISR